MIRIVLADGQPLIREGLRILLDAEPDLRVVACIGDAAATLAAVADGAADVALLDRDLPNPGGIATARVLAARAPRLAVILLATFPDPDEAAQADLAGARAYLPKGLDGGALVEAIRAVAPVRS